jgi:hypothetical protein
MHFYVLVVAEAELDSYRLGIAVREPPRESGRRSWRSILLASAGEHRVARNAEDMLEAIRDETDVPDETR